MQDDPETLTVLLQWEYRHAWKWFQESVGFGLMRGLRSLISPNRTGYELELVSFQFKADALIERKQQFEAYWEALCRSANEDPDVIILRWMGGTGWPI